MTAPRMELRAARTPRPSLPSLAFPVVFTVVLSLSLPVASLAKLQPSRDLGFRVDLDADSILVGDPIPIRLEASGPAGADLRMPVLGDSVGPFTVLALQPARQSEEDGRVRISQEGRVTLFSVGPDTMPPLPLLWVRGDGDTAVAWSQAREVRVGSLLNGDADLTQLRSVKGVVRVGMPDWVRWGGATLLAALFAAVAWTVWRRRRRRDLEEPAMAAVPADPPEVVFERGYAALVAGDLPETGRVKEFFVEISFLLRRYLEVRLGFPAVEETRTEVLERTAGVDLVGEEPQKLLASWLEEGDLVKFAKLERTAEEARVHAAAGAAWVRALASRWEIRESERAAREPARVGSGTAVAQTVSSAQAVHSAAPSAAVAVETPGHAQNAGKDPAAGLPVASLPDRDLADRGDPAGRLPAAKEER